MPWPFWSVTSHEQLSFVAFLVSDITPKIKNRGQLPTIASLISNTTREPRCHGFPGLRSQRHRVVFLSAVFFVDDSALQSRARQGAAALARSHRDALVVVALLTHRRHLKRTPARTAAGRRSLAPKVGRCSEWQTGGSSRRRREVVSTVVRLHGGTATCERIYRLTSNMFQTCNNNVAFNLNIIVGVVGFPPLGKMKTSWVLTEAQRASWYGRRISSIRCQTTNIVHRTVCLLAVFAAKRRGKLFMQYILSLSVFGQRYRRLSSFVVYTLTCWSDSLLTWCKK